jgi:hypothetical protein
MAKKSAPQPEEQPAPAKPKKGTVKPINDAVEEFNRGPILPRGCELEAVEQDIRRYQCFEHGRCVYVMRNNLAVQVSNFTCAIHQHIVDQEHPMKLITIVNVDHQRWTYEVRSEEFLTAMGFRKATTARGNFQWNGTEGDYGKYLSRMMDLMGNGRMILELGWQPEGFFAMANAAINGQVVKYDPHGCFQVGNEQFYVPAGNVIYRRDENKHTNAKRMEFVEGPDFATFSRQLRAVHREHSMTALTFQVATLFSDVIFQRTEGFPLLFLYGAAGSGKDQLIRACQHLCGKPQPEIILSGPSTDKGQVRMLAEFVNISLNLAEFKGGMRREQFEFLKAIWGRVAYRRGNLLGRYTTESVPIRSTVFVSGNDYPNQDDALMTRLIVEEMHKDKFSTEEREQFVVLKRMMEKGYSGILADILKHRQEFERTWYDEHYITAQSIMGEALREKNIDGRMQTNLAILLSTFLFFEKKLQWPFGRGEFILHLVKVITKQQEKRQSGSEVSNWWTCFISAVRQHQLKENINFRIEDGRIMFFWDEVHTVYMRQHREIFNEPGRNSSTMKGKLEHHACWNAHLPSCRIGKRKSSAYAFHMDKTGTDLEGLLQDESVMEALL